MNEINISNMSTNPSFMHPTVLTYKDILGQFTDQALNQMLTISIGFLVLDIYVLEYTNKMDMPTWKEMIDSGDWTGLRHKLLRSIAVICLPLSLFFPILMIGLKTGWYS